MNRPVNLYFGVLIACMGLALSGCVTMEAEQEIAIGKPVEQPARQQGIYHKVKKGETLWRIAQAYDVPVSKITAANKIPKAAKIENDQLLLIPGATRAMDIALDVDKDENEFIWPVQGQVIKYFHKRYDNKLSKGIDIKTRIGEDVVASRTGRVVFADYLPGYGYTVILDHSDGFHSVYANNSKLLVGLNQLVLRNSPLARVGNNRQLASMHFEIRKRSIEDNPLHYLP